MENKEKKELLDCIQNLMASFDSPIAHLKLKGEFADEARKIAREILEKNDVNYRGI